MAKRIKAIVQPSVLSWARESGGFTVDDVARKLRKDPDVILGWESGEARPFMGQLRTLAAFYKRPISDFYLPAPPAERPIPHDFRRSPGEVALVYSPTLRRQLRLARERRDLARALYDELEAPFPTIAEHFLSSADAEGVGARLRTLLGIDFQEQRRWGDGRSAYNAWRRRIEACGVLVFQFRNVSPDEAWGFSICEDELPVIGVNRKLAPNGRTFTMLHELVHILLVESSICDIDDFTPRGADEIRIEVFCNRVAAATLMPQRVFLAHDTVRQHREGLSEWDDDEIRSLARTFGVSREAAVRRLATCGLTTQTFYLRKRRQYHQELEEQRRKELESAKRREIRRNMPQEAISDLGRPYVSLILQNYAEDRITLMHASEYLGVRAEKVRSIEELAAAW